MTTTREIITKWCADCSVTFSPDSLDVLVKALEDDGARRSNAWREERILGDYTNPTAQVRAAINGNDRGGVH